MQQLKAASSFPVLPEGNRSCGNIPALASAAPALAQPDLPGTRAPSPDANTPQSQSWHCHPLFVWCLRGLFKAWKKEGLDFSSICSFLDGGNAAAGRILLIIPTSRGTGRREMLINGNAGLGRELGLVGFSWKLLLPAEINHPTIMVVTSRCFYNFFPGEVVQTGLEESRGAEINLSPRWLLLSWCCLEQ